MVGRSFQRVFNQHARHSRLPQVSPMLFTKTDLRTGGVARGGRGVSCSTSDMRRGGQLCPFRSDPDLWSHRLGCAPISESQSAGEGYVDKYAYSVSGGVRPRPPQTVHLSHFLCIKKASSHLLQAGRLLQSPLSTKSPHAPPRNQPPPRTKLSAHTVPPPPPAAPEKCLAAAPPRLSAALLPPHSLISSFFFLAVCVRVLRLRDNVGEGGHFLIRPIPPVRLTLPRRGWFEV